jgi:hypothetical protein
VNLEPLVSRAPMALTASRVAPELWSVSPARMPAQAWRPMATSWSIGSCLVLLLDQWQSRGIAFVTLGEGIDTSTAAGQLVPGVLASIPVFERARIQERIRAGLSRAKAHGTRLGRRRSVIGKETVVCRFTCACENRQVPGVTRCRRWALRRGTDGARTGNNGSWRSRPLRPRATGAARMTARTF